MKYLKKLVLTTLSALTIVSSSSAVYGNVGDMGFFGGMSQGRRLPKTTEELLDVTNKQQDFIYKEMIFLDGTPREYQGLLTIKGAEIDFDKDLIGTYKETYTIADSPQTPKGMGMNRKIVFDIRYRVSDNQIIKDYEVNSWTETITTPAGTYTLDPKASYFGLSIIEDKTPGVVYYKGDISQKSVYTGIEATLDVFGSFYGYASPYSTTETHRMNGTVTTNEWQMQYQVRPSVTVDKTIVYGVNEPQLTSFAGNYKEVIQNESGLSWNVYVKPNQFFTAETEGNITIDTYNIFEQLIAPNTEFLKGHFAEYDIKKLFAMGVLEGTPKYYLPNQGITRGQYIKMLTKAIKIPTDKYEGNKKSKTVSVVFPDVSETREDYKYIMAAYDAGLAIGRENGFYYPDSQITREEALVILLRTIGLSNLGLDPTPVTSFVDDEKISNWAKREIYAANRIGLISGGADGKINPKLYVTKAEASALTIKLIDYMREEMQVDYGRNIVNFAN